MLEKEKIKDLINFENRINNKLKEYVEINENEKSVSFHDSHKDQFQMTQKLINNQNKLFENHNLMLKELFKPKETEIKEIFKKTHSKKSKIILNFKILLNKRK